MALPALAWLASWTPPLHPLSIHGVTSSGHTNHPPAPPHVKLAHTDNNKHNGGGGWGVGSQGLHGRPEEVLCEKAGGDRKFTFPGN